MLITYFCGEAPICQPLPPLPDFPLNHADFTLVNTSGVWPEVLIGVTITPSGDVWTFDWVGTSQVAQQPEITTFASAAVPEPATWALMLFGMVAVLFARKFWRRPLIA